MADKCGDHHKQLKSVSALLCHSRTKVRALILRRPLTPQSWIPEQNVSAQNQEATNEPVRNGYADCRSPTSDFSRYPSLCSVREYQKKSYIVHYEHRSIV
ncbi:hypothetical protein Forpi1262_v012131 [Fusarium oxysporum f. sp. raphani]|uniref:Uncharacterized protein n=1 Tax=Fusarium oxysporum f. sp. raphani TaxID=96318 RepID=A0A8J5U246_FUSOX|nr:hypothetical protein Forpi1262_v012131 [Fusarium oxysporum f. sp. raphani]